MEVLLAFLLAYDAVILHLFYGAPVYLLAYDVPGVLLVYDVPLFHQFFSLFHLPCDDAQVLHLVVFL